MEPLWDVSYIATTVWNLQELFEDYTIESATVNYDEIGESAGSADVVTDRASAEEIINNFGGIALDGSFWFLFIFRLGTFLVGDLADEYLQAELMSSELRHFFTWL